MQRIETKRLILREFDSQDWSDVLELALDWESAPGPAFDKLPTTEAECKQFTEKHLNKSDRCYAMCLRGTNKVVGLLGLNGCDDKGRFDLGHIIHSSYKDDAHDREALGAVVDYIFGNQLASTIVTHNADDPRQLAPLRSLGFWDGNPAEGELMMTKAVWDQSRRNLT